MRIKLIISLVLMLIFCGSASAQPANKKPEAGTRQGMPAVPLCEVVSHPARYKNKVVRVEAIYLIYYHGAYLYGAQCNEPRMYVDPSISCRGGNDSSCVELQRGLDKLVEPHLRWDERKYARRAKVILVGRFRRVYPRYRDGGGNLIVRVGPNADLRFELRIIRPESVSPVADGILYTSEGLPVRRPLLSNNGMHPTRDTLPLIFSKGAGGRVMPGVRFCDGSRRRT